MPIRRLILCGIGMTTLLLVVAVPTLSSAQRTNLVTILVRHEENATQIVRALTSLIELCRERQ